MVLVVVEEEQITKRIGGCRRCGGDLLVINRDESCLQCGWRPGENIRYTQPDEAPEQPKRKQGRPPKASGRGEQER